MTPPPIRVGLVGCGTISDVYITNGTRLGGYRVAACADLDPARAEAKAQQHSIARACSFQQMLADPDIDLILNLTPPAAHAAVGLAAAEAGKHVYSEKPLSIRPDDARRMLDLASRNARMIGCAPDTFLGAGYQTCVRLIAEGAIGSPVGAVACMMCRGPESWHSDPEFFYKPGAGPLFDMGPYYITALVSLLGPVRRVTSLARASFKEREITSRPQRGRIIRVETPTHIVASIEFAAGPLATLLMSFDVWTHSLPFIEIYGSEGTLSAPDPNTYSGPVTLHLRDEPQARQIPLDPGHSDNSRGLGIRDLAAALAESREPRASGNLGLHVLETMHAILESAQNGRAVTLTSPSRDRSA